MANLIGYSVSLVCTLYLYPRLSFFVMYFKLGNLIGCGLFSTATDNTYILHTTVQRAVANWRERHLDKKAKIYAGRSARHRAKHCSVMLSMASSRACCGIPECSRPCFERNGVVHNFCGRSHAREAVDRGMLESLKPPHGVCHVSHIHLQVSAGVYP